MPRKQGLKIQQVDTSGPAFKSGIRSGDILEWMNGHEIQDILDVRFYSASNKDHCRFRRGTKRINVDLPSGADWGVEFEPMRFHACGNHCIFCFVDQNPPDLRKSLYFKDEDYRLSFLHGNYVTLSHVSDGDLKRIADLRLSPLYVSVHATDDEVRRRMLGRTKSDNLLGKLDFLRDHGIEIHTQIVLCPGINDGEVLDETIETLSRFYPAMQSVAVVPVGLTKHRRGLPVIKKVDRDKAGELIRQIKRLQKQFKKTRGTRLVYAADEIFVKAGKRIPSESYYEDFVQLENGVGLIRHFLMELREARKEFPKNLKRPVKYAIITGTLAAPILRRKLLPATRHIRGLELIIAPVPNTFFGKTVTVSGLLTGSDIAREARNLPGDAELLIPSHCLNEDGLFLDGETLRSLEKAAGRRAHRVETPWQLWGIA